MRMKRCSDIGLAAGACLALVGLTSAAACSRPASAEPPKVTQLPAGSPLDPPRLTPEEERRTLTDYLKNSGPVPRTYGHALSKGVDDLFQDTFARVIQQKAAFTCFKAGCFQDTVTDSLATIERLDQAMIAPDSPFVGLPGTLHRGAPIKRPDGGFVVTWTYVLTDKDVPVLLATLQQPARAPKNKQP